MNKILFLDDHKVILSLVGKYLSDNLDAEIVKANNITEFMELDHDIDLYIIDLSLDEGSGFDVLDILSKDYRNKVIVFTSNVESGVIRHLYNLKIVNGIVNKSSEESELVVAVESVSNGGEFLCKRSSKIIDSSKRNYYDLSDKLAELSVREREVLKLIWENHSTKEIAKLLFVSSFTINNHRKNIRKKLGADSLVSILKIAFKKGYLTTITD